MIPASLTPNVSEVWKGCWELGQPLARYPLRILRVGNPLRLLLPRNLRKLVRFLLAVRSFRRQLRDAVENPQEPIPLNST